MWSAGSGTNMANCWVSDGGNGREGELFANEVEQPLHRAVRCGRGSIGHSGACTGVLACGWRLTLDNAPLI